MKYNTCRVNHSEGGGNARCYVSPLQLRKIAARIEVLSAHASTHTYTQRNLVPTALFCIMHLRFLISVQTNERWLPHKKIHICCGLGCMASETSFLQSGLLMRWFFSCMLIFTFITRTLPIKNDGEIASIEHLYFSMVILHDLRILRQTYFRLSLLQIVILKNVHDPGIDR
jgi:hypothetical protein